jgi:hypothetical protein
LHTGATFSLSKSSGSSPQSVETQENIGIAPLRHKGSMTNDSKEKANVLNDQLKSVFTNRTSTTLDKSTIDRGFNIKTENWGTRSIQAAGGSMHLYFPPHHSPYVLCHPRQVDIPFEDF